MKGLGYGKGYRYAHDEEGAYAAGEHYLPDDMKPQEFYTPTERGLEAQIREKLERLRLRDQEAGGEEPDSDDVTDVAQASDRIDECSTSIFFATTSRRVAAGLAKRGVVLDTARFETLEAQRKEIQTRAQELQARRNALSKQIGIAKGKGEDAASLMADVAGLGR